jgi:hypothetical protein
MDLRTCASYRSFKFLYQAHFLILARLLIVWPGRTISGSSRWDVSFFHQRFGGSTAKHQSDCHSQPLCHCFRSYGLNFAAFISRRFPWPPPARAHWRAPVRSVALRSCALSSRPFFRDLPDASDKRMEFGLEIPQAVILLLDQSSEPHNT